MKRKRTSVAALGRRLDAFSARLWEVEKMHMVHKNIIDYLMKSKDYIPQAQGDNASRNQAYLDEKVEEFRQLINKYEASRSRGLVP